LDILFISGIFKKCGDWHDLRPWDREIDSWVKESKPADRLSLKEIIERGIHEQREP